MGRQSGIYRALGELGKILILEQGTGNPELGTLKKKNVFFFLEKKNV
jgi:hypothetical protein